MGAYAELRGGNIFLRGFYADEAENIYEKGTITGTIEEAGDIALRLAEKLRKGGVFKCR